MRGYDMINNNDFETDQLESLAGNFLVNGYAIVKTIKIRLYPFSFHVECHSQLLPRVTQL